MAGINKAIIVGRLGQDPEIRYMPDGTPVANFSVATSDEWTDKNTGEKKERTEWHRIVAWRRLAEICAQYLSKGRQVYIEGRIQTEEWQDKEGIKRYTTKIIASTMQMLGSRTDAGNQAGAGQGGYAQGGGAGQGSYQGGANQGMPQQKSSQNEKAYPSGGGAESGTYQNPAAPGGSHYADEMDVADMHDTMDTMGRDMPVGDGPDDDDIPF